MSPPDHNLARLVFRHAVSSPERLALEIPITWDSEGVQEIERVTFAELALRAASAQSGLRQAGLRPGDRLVVMLEVSIGMYALALGAMAAGMTVVLVDAGMTKRRIVQAIVDANAKVIVSTRAVLRARWLVPKLWGMKGLTADDAFAESKQLTVLPRGEDDQALITFTSGSTGRPKGADRTHRLMVAQHLALADLLPPHPSDVDMPCFPVVALHNLACGVPTVMPAVDLRAPASVSPPALFAQMQSTGVRTLSGAPAFISALTSWMVTRGYTLPAVRRVAVGGAPVSRALCAEVLMAFPEADARIVYGSTEAEPISSVSMRDVVASGGDGYLVGEVVPAAQVRIVNLPDDAPVLDHRGLDPYDVVVGEIVVSGAHVNRRYIDNPTADRANKVFGLDGTVWHRTGDVGHFDGAGRIWLTGRTADLVEHRGYVVHPLPVEATLDGLAGVRRAAIVATDGQRANVVVELEGGHANHSVVRVVQDELTRLGLGSVPVRTVDAIPVDGRHNSKIDRPALRRRFS